MEREKCTNKIKIGQIIKDKQCFHLLFFSSQGQDDAEVLLKSHSSVTRADMRRSSRESPLFMVSAERIKWIQQTVAAVNGWKQFSQEGRSTVSLPCLSEAQWEQILRTHPDQRDECSVICQPAFFCFLLVVEWMSQSSGHLKWAFSQWMGSMSQVSCTVGKGCRKPTAL